MKSIKLSEIKVAHYQVWSEMSPETFSQLKADIKANGIVLPLIVDEFHTLLDGHHRYRAAKECGLKDAPVIVKPNLSEEEKLGIAYKLNSTVREISRAEKQHKAQELNAEGRSVRQIATWLGVGKSSVQRWLKPEPVASVPDGTVKRDDVKSRQDTEDVARFAELERQVAELKVRARCLEDENESLRGTTERYALDISRLERELKAALERSIRFSSGSDNGMRVFAHMVGLSQSASLADVRRAFRKAQGTADSDRLKHNDSSRTWVSQRYNTAPDLFAELYG